MHLAYQVLDDLIEATILAIVVLFIACVYMAHNHQPAEVNPPPKITKRALV